MVVEKYRAFTFNTRTGKIAGTLPGISPSWGMRLNDAGTVEVTIPTDSEEALALNVKAMTQENRMCLGISYGATILEAGPILERDLDEESGELTIVAEGVLSIFDARKVLPKWAQVPRATNTQRAVVSWQNRRLSSIVRNLIALGMDAPPWESGRLPIVLGPDIGGTESRSWNGFDLRNIGDVVRELAAEQEGPDFRLRPRYRGDDGTYVEWILETGEPLLRQAGPDYVWDASKPDTGVTIGSANSNGRRMAARAWRPGQGQEQDMPLGQATNEAMVREEGLPWLDTDTASKQEPNLRVLDALAAQDLEEASGPVQAFTVRLRADGITPLHMIRPGDFAEVVVPRGHALLASGRHSVRIMAVDGDDDETYSVQVMGEIGSLLGDEGSVEIIEGENTARPRPIVSANTLAGYNTLVGNGG